MAPLHGGRREHLASASLSVSELRECRLGQGIVRGWTPHYHPATRAEATLSPCWRGGNGEAPTSDPGEPDVDLESPMLRTRKARRRTLDEIGLN